MRDVQAQGTSMTGMAATWLTPPVLALGAICAGAGLCIGLAVAAMFARARRAALIANMDWIEADRDECRESLDTAEAELARLRSEQASLRERLSGEQRHAAEKLAMLAESKAQMTDQFKTLSQEILEEKAKSFDASTKASLAPLIEPLREHIGRFEKQVRDAYDAENRQRSALAQQIRMLEQSNRAIAEDAMNLANALRGESKTQGNWGEMILETVLERSGLEKDRQYVTQFSATDEDGRRRLPDAVVQLPGERSLVIDAKVSLTAYLRVQEADDEDARRHALGEHIASVRRHLKQLSAKNYQGIAAIRTLDYVFMFVPSEAAYVEALRGDFDLQREALDANIALVSPVTLMPMLRTVENLWRLDKQEKNAELIAARAGTLYDKFVGFLADLDKVSRSMETATQSLADARGKLTDGRGNLVRQVEMLRAMGANAGKTTPADWQERAELGEQRVADDGRQTAAGPHHQEETE